MKMSKELLKLAHERIRQAIKERMPRTAIGNKELQRAYEGKAARLIADCEDEYQRFACYGSRPAAEAVSEPPID